VITVMIVDDQEMIRTGLRSIIDSHPELTVVAEAGDGASALRSLRSAPVDVVLMDIRMPGMDGVETTRLLRETYPSDRLRILVLTTFDEDENVLAALRAGADGFFSKGAGPTELTAGIVQVARGEHALSATALSAVVGHVADAVPETVDPSVVALFERLTAREREVVGAVVRGLDNTAIAKEMFLSPLTVKTHVNRAMMKVGARDRAQLVSLAFLAGMRP
jgi:DNA-binding NarL/FixJ family response regulator